jgi:hypothetical protein
VLVLLLAQAAAGWQTSDTKVGLLENPETHRWCAYGDLPSWQIGVDSLSAVNVGQLSYSRGDLKEILFTREHETEDWSVADKYFVGSGGIERVSRLITIQSANLEIEESYLIRNRAAVRQSRSVRSLSSGKAASVGSTWVPNVPVATRVQDLPFADFVELRRVAKYPGSAPVCH